MNIQMEPLTMGDCDEIFELFNNDLVLASYADKPIKSKKGTKEFVERITTKSTWTWKIVDKDLQNRILGICSLHHLDPSMRTIEIGGTLFPDYWGKGIMKKAFEQLIQHAIKEFQVVKVYAKTSSSNYKALELVKKLGFEIENSDADETLLAKTINI